jgi:hypothetical protein
MSKSFLIALKRRDPSQDYSRLDSFLEPFHPESHLNHRVVRSTDAWHSAQQLRDALQPLLHSGDLCTVAEILDYVTRASDGI